MKILRIKTKLKNEVIDITNEVENLVKDVKDGICVVFVKHATAAIIINENYDKSVCDDILDCLNKLVPSGIWKHDKMDNNADAHIKASILGPSELIVIKDGKLQLGRWQGVGLVELDGPREREVVVRVL